MSEPFHHGRPRARLNAGRFPARLLIVAATALAALFALVAPAQPTDEKAASKTAGRRPSSRAARPIRLPPAGSLKPDLNYLNRFSSALPNARLPQRREWRDQFNYSIVTVMNDIRESRRRALKRTTDGLELDAPAGAETAYGPGVRNRATKRPRIRPTPRYDFQPIRLFYQKLRTFD